MRLSFGWWLALTVFVGLFTVHLVTSFERPPVTVVQRGFRGTAMELVYNPRLVEVNAYLHKVPEAPEPADTGEPYARDVYQNVQVLGDLSIQQFGRLMQSITEWVSPEVDNPEPGAPQRGCNYCHNPENYAEDSIYTKVVSRRMLQMTKHINEHWKSHVGEAGVTCYTCHRGNPPWSACPRCPTTSSRPTSKGTTTYAWPAARRFRTTTAIRSSRPSGLTA